MNVAMNIVHKKGASVMDSYFLLKTGALRVIHPMCFVWNDHSEVSNCVAWQSTDGLLKPRN